MTFNIPVNEENLYYRYLAAINGMLNLSNKEMLVLSEFLRYHMEYGDAEVAITPVTRKRVQEKFDMSAYNVNNVITNLKKKHALIKLDKTIVVAPRIVPNLIDSNIIVTINFTKL